MTINEIADIAQIVSVLVLVFSVLYASRQLKLLRLTHSDNHDWNRRKSAQDLTMELNIILGDTEDLHKKLNVINRVEPIPLSDIDKAINEDPSVQLKINKMLNIYSSVARGVLNGVYDREIIATARRRAMIKTYDSFSSYISKRRKESIPTLWIYYEHLVIQWKGEITKKEPRELTGLSTENSK